MAKTDNGNGRVTMAVLGTKLDTVIEKLEELQAQRNKDRDEQDKDHDRIGVLEGEINRVKDRQGVMAGLQAGLALLLSAAAAWWGSRP